MLLRLGLGISPACQNQSIATSVSSPAEFNNLQAFLDAQDLSSFTFSSGSGDGDPVSNWLDNSSEGNDFTKQGGNNDFFYIASGIHGKPALRKSDPSGSMTSDAADLYGSSGTVIYFFTPLSVRTVTNGPIGSLLSSFGAFGLAGDRIYYDINEAGARITSASLDLSQVIMAGISFEDVDNAKFIINNTTTDFDPSNSLNINGGVQIGWSTTINTPELEYYGVLVFDRDLAPIEISQIYDWGQARYS